MTTLIVIFIIWSFIGLIAYIFVMGRKISRGDPFNLGPEIIFCAILRGPIVIFCNMVAIPGIILYKIMDKVMK